MYSTCVVHTALVLMCCVYKMRIDFVSINMARKIIFHIFKYIPPGE